MPNPVVRMLEQRFKDRTSERWVFATKNSTTYRPRNIERWITEIREIAEKRGVSMESTFHSSRHAWATKAVSAGWDWESIRNQLDHHSAAFTAGRYAHPVGRDLDPDVGMLTPLTNRSRRSQNDTSEEMADDATDGDDSEIGARDRDRTGDPQLGKLN